jgi:hypothetical protein
MSRSVLLCLLLLGPFTVPATLFNLHVLRECVEVRK